MTRGRSTSGVWGSLARSLNRHLENRDNSGAFGTFILSNPGKKVSRHLDDQILISRCHKIIFERYSSSDGHLGHFRAHADRPTILSTMHHGNSD